MREVFLDNYQQDGCLLFQNLKQKDMSEEEYTAKFDHLMMKCEIVELEV